MQLILYGGLYNNLSNWKIMRLIRNKKYDIIYFDFDDKKPCQLDFSYLPELLKDEPNNISLMINVLVTFNKDSYMQISKDLGQISLHVDDLFVTSPNDLFTCVLKKYLRYYIISYAYHNKDNVDDSSYLLCESNTATNYFNDIKHLILDDRESKNNGIFYTRNSKKKIKLITDNKI
ncbi:MAG: hypothetical protein RR404_04015 [Bacilli bacterium]